MARAQVIFTVPLSLNYALTSPVHRFCNRSRLLCLVEMKMLFVLHSVVQSTRRWRSVCAIPQFCRVFTVVTLSSPVVLNGYTLKCSGVMTERQTARLPVCQKIEGCFRPIWRSTLWCGLIFDRNRKMWDWKG